MNRDEITAEILAALKEVAPEVDAGTLDPARNFRDQFEFDSIDFLDLVLKLEKRLGDQDSAGALSAVVFAERRA